MRVSKSKISSIPLKTVPIDPTARAPGHIPLPNGDAAVPTIDEADEGVETGPPMTTNFDPIAVGDEIAGHLVEADKAAAANHEHSTAAGTLLLDVRENHPEHLDAICDRIGLGRSRRAELMMIAGGRKTVEQSRAQNKARVEKHRAKKKTATLPPPLPSENPLHRPVMDDPSAPASRGNGAAPEATADATNVAEVAADAQTGPDSEPKPVPKPPRSWKNSAEALAQFKYAVNHWIKQMNPDDTAEAIAYAKAVGEQHRAKILEMAA